MQLNLGKCNNYQQSDHISCMQGHNVLRPQLGCNLYKTVILFWFYADVQYMHVHLNDLLLMDSKTSQLLNDHSCKVDHSYEGEW